MPRVTN